MPLYEYQCQSCEERLEAIQKYSDPQYTHCPKCGGDLKKLISSPAIQFKGSGFYITDYARSGSSGKKSGGGEGSSSEGSPSKKEGSSSEGSSSKKEGSNSEGSSSKKEGSNSEGSSSKKSDDSK